MRKIYSCNLSLTLTLTELVSDPTQILIPDFNFCDVAATKNVLQTWQLQLNFNMEILLRLNGNLVWAPMVCLYFVTNQINSHKQNSHKQEWTIK